MADTAEVLEHIDLCGSESRVMVTIANVRGAEQAMQYSYIDEISFPYSISESFLKRNINSDKKKALQTIDTLLNLCDKNRKTLILYNSMAFGNAYGEDWNPEMVVEDTKQLQKMGVKSLILSDTVDLGEPLHIYKTCKSVIQAYPEMENRSAFAYHSQRLVSRI